ncbi:MAG: LytR/AlgR family response regulator transcription factor [Bacteroidota bacterium]
MNHTNTGKHPVNKIAIIEDEKAERENLKSVIHSFFPEIEITGEAETVQEGLTLIRKINPDILMLDIELKDGNSFDLLKKLDTINFQIIWLTAYDEYAIRAFRISAVDFLLKPYKTEDLIRAIMKAREQLLEQHYLERIHVLLKNTTRENTRQLVLQTSEATHVVKLDEIIRCQCDNNYTTFVLTDNSKILMSKPLKLYDEMLSGLGFFRVHQSHLINLQKIKKVSRKKNGKVLMANHDTVPVAEVKYNGLMSLLDRL